MIDETGVSELTTSGVFLITLATMLHEILLTRIFSVTIWYHFAFVAISLAMFGMTIGGLEVYQHPERYCGALLSRKMSLSALSFAISALASVLLHVLVSFGSTLLTTLWVTITCSLLVTPFYFSGVCVCIALTKFPLRVSQLYAADLLGAASGCVLLIYVLRVTDAPTAVALVATLGSLAGAVFAADGRLPGLRRGAVALSLIFAAVVILNSFLVGKQSSLLRVTWAKGQAQARPLFEEWNSFSRIAVEGNPGVATGVITEGISETYHGSRQMKQLPLKVDADAETTLTAFSGSFHGLDYLKFDVKNLVHYIRPNANVLIIGAGGGRDVLSALLFGQKTVRAIEINQAILRTVNGRFGDFTGHLDSNPKVTFVNDEARSYIARTDEHFDIIEGSFIDTWAASSAGALTLSENSLYTVEAWKLFLDRLSPDGVLSFSRWYAPALPAEAYRLTSLAAAALRAHGVDDPSSHILLAGNLRHDLGRDQIGAVTILVSNSPVSSAELEQFESVSRQMQFQVILSPRYALNTLFSELATGQDPSTIGALLGLKLSAPTDDSPFFFQMKPLRNSFRTTLTDNSGHFRSYLQSGERVAGLLLIVTFLTLLFVLLPLFRKTQNETLSRSVPYLVFFAAIGFGFMLIEISQMQRLIILLGHPVYALSVVLFTLLLAGGLGSLTTRTVGSSDRSAIIRMSVLVLLLLAFGFVTPRASSAFSSSPTPVRVAVAVGILFPLGFFMGMAFPLGLRRAEGDFDALMPAFWGINGATSICGSVLAVVISMNSGISSSFWTGFWCYTLSFCAYLWVVRSSLRPCGKSRDQAIAVRIPRSPYQ